MQSLRQYRSLERRLQQQHTTVRESATRQPTNANALTSTYHKEKQDLWRPNIGRQARQEEDLEKQDLNPLDLQNAIKASAPSTISGTDASEGISTQASTIGLDSLNSTAYALDSAITLPQSFSGINVQKKDFKSASKDSVAYIVELGDDDNDINPQSWGRAFKIWATYVNLSIHNPLFKDSESISLTKSTFQDLGLLPWLRCRHCFLH